ncbi:GPW/gp25 family protein [Lentzea sp. PSKA42]|uniref:GPW/gp25 family protein n=1 Tax=Lentzea indica TaxID=2604800 RepID=A0ABX1FF64_9PSEU|nr:GPW/gp25 family protein [Lentzea indica]NKE57555.1 GPW/gp25 family protein [Lentzea indica]
MTLRVESHGRGTAFPISITERGGVAEVAGPAILDQSIRIILGTAPGERAMRPDFGCELASLVFAPNNAATANLARLYVESALTRWEPRIELGTVDVVNDLDRNALVITVHYRTRESAEQRSTTVAVELGAPR